VQREIKMNIQHFIKEDKYGVKREYPFEYDWEYGDEDEHPHENPNISCSCGNNEFKVCWWDYPYSGGFCKIVCTKCGNELVLIDDYA
jgi:hypothetical protein